VVQAIVVVSLLRLVSVLGLTEVRPQIAALSKSCYPATGRDACERL
jgi:hypothetical protein